MKLSQSVTSTQRSICVLVQQGQGTAGAICESSIQFLWQIFHQSTYSTVCNTVISETLVKIKTPSGATEDIIQVGELMS